MLEGCGPTTATQQTLFAAKQTEAGISACGGQMLLRQAAMDAYNSARIGWRIPHGPLDTVHKPHSVLVYALYPLSLLTK